VLFRHSRVPAASCDGSSLIGKLKLRPQAHASAIRGSLPHGLAVEARRIEPARTSRRLRRNGLERYFAPGFGTQTLHQPLAFTSLPGKRLHGRHSSPSLPVSCMQFAQLLPGLN
jgi:hypothetical protein